MTPTPWRITWGERSWTDEDLLASDVADLQTLCADGWRSADPWRSPGHLIAAIAVLESRTAGRDFQEVLEEIRNSPARELAEAIDSRPLEATGAPVPA